jgi:tetratricopeptide (TPR) repeat protein
MAMRRYEEAATAFGRAVTFNPDMDLSWNLRVQNEYARGDTAAAVAALQEIPDAVLSEPFTESMRIEFLRLRRDYRGLLDRVLATPVDLISVSGRLQLLPLHRGYAYQGLGETERAKAAFEEARVLAQTTLSESPDDHRVPGALGLVLAELGLRDEAVAAGRLGAEMLTVADDALWGSGTSYVLAQIHARLGESEAAVDLLEYVLSVPSQAGHIGLIELDPLFDPIRSNPRFQALIERYSN